MIINLDSFMAKEKVYWDQLSQKLDHFENYPNAKLSYEEISEVYYLYKRSVSGLSKIRTFSAERDKIDGLNMLVGRAYSYLHGSERTSKINPINDWFFIEIPISFKRHINKFFLAILFTVAGMIFGGGVLLLDYEAKPYLLPFSHLMGSPSDRVAAENKLDGKNISGHEAPFASFLMTHNIKVSVLALALGLTLGVGTIIMMFYNGVILGAVITDYILDVQGLFLGGWLMPHGVIVIPAIIIAGQIGFIFARYQLSAFWQKEFVEETGRNRKDMVNLFFCLVIMLVWAGIVEAFLSQYHEPFVKYEYKILFGMVELFLLVAFLSGKMGKFLTARKNKKV